LKILRVTSDLYPYVVGGLGLHAREMSKSQVKSGHEVTVLTTSIANAASDIQDGFKLASFKNSFRFLGNTISSELLYKLFNINREYDIIHAHSHLFFSTNVCALVRKFSSTPLVITNHGIMSASAPDWLNLLYLNTLGKWTLNTADKIICYTEDEKEYLINTLRISSSKVVVISNGVDTDKFCPREEHHQSNGLKILWAGRFVNGKGVEYLIRAIDILVKEVPDLHLTLVGEGPERESIQTLINDLGLSDNIDIIDFVPYEEMPQMYQASDIFVLPSLHEGVPRTVIEAMSCGLPVVVSDFPHLHDLINGGGLMFPKRDIQSLVDVLRELACSKEVRLQIGRRAREKVIKDYSWESTVSRTLTLYQEIIARNKV